MLLEINNSHMNQQTRLDQFRHRIRAVTYFGSDKIDAILAYLQEHYSAVGRRRIPTGFRRNLLLGLQAINEYARHSGIRFEDALMVLHDFATNPDTVAATETNELVADE
jgi:hypothetical protein